MDARVGMNQNTFGGESLRAVTGDGVAVIEVPVLGGIEFHSAVVVEPCNNPTIEFDRLDDGEVAVGDAEMLTDTLFSIRNLLHASLLPEFDERCCAPPRASNSTADLSAGSF